MRQETTNKPSWQGFGRIFLRGQNFPDGEHSEAGASLYKLQGLSCRKKTAAPRSQAPTHSLSAPAGKAFSGNRLLLIPAFLENLGVFSNHSLHDGGYPFGAWLTWKDRDHLTRAINKNQRRRDFQFVAPGEPGIDLGGIDLDSMKALGRIGNSFLTENQLAHRLAGHPGRSIAISVNEEHDRLASLGRQPHN